MVCNDTDIVLIVEICHLMYKQDKSEWRFHNNVAPRTNKVQRRAENTLNKYAVILAEYESVFSFFTKSTHWFE